MMPCRCTTFVDPKIPYIGPNDGFIKIEENATVGVPDLVDRLMADKVNG